MKKRKDINKQAVICHICKKSVSNVEDMYLGIDGKLFCSIQCVDSRRNYLKGVVKFEKSN